MKKRPLMPPPASERRQRLGRMVRHTSAKIANRKLQQINLRQTVSDRIGYLIASMLGAGTMHWFGWRGVQALGALYLLSLIFAYSRYTKKPLE